MPFCQHCGKEVQTEWVTCPFCSVSISSSNAVNIGSDSAVGEINNISNIVNNHSTQIASSTQCPSCKATGNVSIFTCHKGKCSNPICDHCKIEIDKNFPTCGSCFHDDCRADFLANPWKFEMTINSWFEQDLLDAGIAVTEPLRRRIAGNVEIGVAGFDHEKKRKEVYAFYSIPYPGPKKRKKPGFFAKLDHALNTPTYLLDKEKKR